MLDGSPRVPSRSRPSLWSRLRQRHWGESSVYAFIFLAGFVFSLIQTWTWVLPYLTLRQEFVLSRCSVIDVKIEKRDGPVGPIYRPLVLIEHEVKDQTFRIWAFDFQTLKSSQRAGFSSDYSAAEKALRPFRSPNLPPDRQVDCRYRIGRPEQVVVFWSVSIWGWFFLLLSVSLCVLGLVGFCQSFRLNPMSPERQIAKSSKPSFGADQMPPSSKGLLWPTVPDIRFINESPGTHLAFRLPPVSQPLFPLLGITFFALAWNLVAGSIFFYSLIYSGDDISGQIAGTILRSLFFGVGILLMAWTLHKILLVFGTGPTLLEISDHPIYPGRRYRVLVQQTGVLRFREFRVEVVCEEIARFRQGTETITSRKDVFRQPLFCRNDFETSADTPLHQEFFLCLPMGAMHSFRQDNNEIAWKLSVFARISGWPDIVRECPIVVRPSIWSGQVQEGIGL